MSAPPKLKTSADALEIAMKLDFSPRQEASCTLLDGSGDAIRVRLIALSGRHLTVDTEADLGNGVPVKLVWGSYIVLGEVSGRSVQGLTTLTIRHILRQDDVDSFGQNWF